MLFPNYLLLIDSSYLVYEVPRSDLNTYGQMVLNISGVPLEDYWTAFKDDENWKSFKGQYKSFFHVIDNGIIYVYIDVFPCHYPGCIRYNTSNNEIETSWTSDVFEHEQVIMDDRMERSYTISTDGTNPPFMWIWTFNFWNGKGIPAGRLYYIVNEKDASDRNVTVLLGTEIYTPTDNPLRDNPRFKGYRLENLTADWDLLTEHVPVGFLYKGHFNLYSYQKAMFFADTLPTYQEMVEINNTKKFPPGTVLMNSKLSGIPVRQYIQCAGDAPNESLVTWPPTQVFQPITFVLRSSHSNLLFVYICVAVLAILVVIACIVYFFCISKKSGHHGKHSKKGKGKGHKEQESVGSKQQSKVSSTQRKQGKVSSTIEKPNDKGKSSSKLSMQSSAFSKQSQL